MRFDEFNTYIENIKNSLKGNPQEYIKFLKVVGNNQKYDLSNQLSIYYTYPEATACASEKLWRERFLREIAETAIRIPILKQNQTVDYVLDYSQTKSVNNNLNDIDFWKFNIKDNDTLALMINNRGHEATENSDQNVKILSEIYVKDQLPELVQDLKIEDNNFLIWLEEVLLNSVSFSVGSRLGIGETEFNILNSANSLMFLDTKIFTKIIESVSKTTKELIDDTITLSKTRNKQIEELDKSYSDNENNHEMEEDKNELDRSNAITRTVLGGRSSDRRGLETIGRAGSTLLSDNGRSDGSVTAGQGIFGEISEHDVRRDETGLSRTEQRENEDGTSGRNVREERAIESSERSSRESYRDEGVRETENDESLEYREREQSSISDNDVSAERDNNQVSSRGLEREVSSTSLSNFGSDYWIVEFNENHELVPDYSGQIVTKDLINILRQKDIDIKDHNQILGENEFGELTDDYIGYFKIYFDHYVDGEVVEHYRIDIGDGAEINEREFSYLEEQIELSQEKAEQEEPKQVELSANNEVKIKLNNISLGFYPLGNGYTVADKNINDKKANDYLTVGVINSDRTISLFDKALYNHYSRNEIDDIINEIKFKALVDNSNVSLTQNAKLFSSQPLFDIDNLTKDQKEQLKSLDISVNKLNDYILSNKIRDLSFEERINDIYNFSKEIAQTMDRYNVPRESAEGLVRGKEDLKNLGYETDTERLSFARNYNLKNHIYSEYLTPSEKLDKNIKAIKMLKRLENENRSPREYEQAYLADYLGWGGLSDVFDENKGGQWKEAREYLKENLSNVEYQNAKESTLTAFYTPKEVIDSIYDTLSDMGFKSGNILEPSAGVGNFIGNLPGEMKNSKVYGVELDSLSGRIARQLYPEADIQIKGFEDTNFSNNFFDLVVGNVPFGDFKVNDREYNNNNFLIHDYFFAKSIDKVRNGGIIAFITSSGTMDKKDESVRRYINARAEFLGAIRLPNTTFKGLAGTEVTSDIIFLKKRDSVINREANWLHLDTDENGLRYNKYFVDNPQMVLGDMKEVSGRFGNTLTCVEKDRAELRELLEAARKNISINNKYEEIELLEDEEITLPATDDVKNFAYTVVDNEVYMRENSILIKQELTDKNKDKIKDYLKVVTALRDVISKQKDDFSDEEIKQSQVQLNAVYDEFSKKYGHINKSTNSSILKTDSNFPLVSSLEIIDQDNNFQAKSDIFFKRTISKARVVEKVDTSLEALVLSVSQKGGVDFEYMEELTDKTTEVLIKELKGEIFLDIKEHDDINNARPFESFKNVDSFHFNYVTANEYLSGNIRKKIAYLTSYIGDYESVIDVVPIEERASLETELKELKYQRDKLQEVMPKELIASEINVRLGATWIPPKDIEKFIFETLKTPGYDRWNINVRYSEHTSEWNIEGKSSDRYNELANMTYGTSRVNAYKLIENALNLRDTKVYDQIVNDDGSKTSVLNKKETLLANQKQELLREEFKNWIFEDPDRRYRLEKIYNEKFNSIRNREYDGSNLVFDGINPEIELRDHQKDAIARTLFGGNTLLAHVVGAGKTYEMVASAMEAKRLGLCTKSLFVVPNHITGQIGREFMQLYPSANIMIADKKDFEPKNRKRFIGRIATGEYDAVIIGHSQFEKIPMSKEYQEQHINEQLEDIISAIEQYKYDNNQNFTVKQLEKTRKKWETKLEKLNDDFKKDDVITFEELGVDKLFIDEAHNYKNLFLQTKMSNVAGIGQSEALKSSDMFMKCRYMDEMTGNKGVVFATGTPISNSMTELYTMQRYLQYDLLKETGFDNFDSWASTFGETENTFELSPEGTGYRQKTRFSKFWNLPELMSMFKEVADIKTADMLNLPTPEVEYHVLKTMPSEEQKEILSVLAERADAVRSNQVEPIEDNMLKITNDGKKLALDQRLINPYLPDDPDSKVNKCIENVYSIWEKTIVTKSTQLIFSDMSTPKGDGEFNIYDDIRDKLERMGVPKSEIAFIHEASSDKQKESLFSKVRKGEIRILLGSTQKMGAGTNIQDKLIALHDLDVPWRPSDLEQFQVGQVKKQGLSQ